MAFKNPNEQMVISPIVDNLDSVDERYRDLYGETTDGKFQLKADIAFQSDFENTRNALSKEREYSKELKAKIKSYESQIEAYGGVDPTAVKGMRAELDSLKSSETDLMKVKAINADLTLKYNDLTEKFKTVTKENETYQQEKRNYLLREGARNAFRQNGMPDFALEDGLMYAERYLEVADDGSIRVKDTGNNTIFPAGIGADSFAQILKKEKPHLYGGSVGGGAGGSSAVPTGSDSWIKADGSVNVTKLAKFAREDPKGTLAVARRNKIDLSGYMYMFPKDIDK